MLVLLLDLFDSNDLLLYIIRLSTIFQSCREEADYFLDIQIVRAKEDL